ncbi:MAG: hypothetical protein DIU76_12110, partial [Bacillota bacterium]
MRRGGFKEGSGLADHAKDSPPTSRLTSTIGIHARHPGPVLLRSRRVPTRGNASTVCGPGDPGPLRGQVGHILCQNPADAQDSSCEPVCELCRVAMETESVAIPIIDQDGRSPGELHVHVLPGRRPTEGPPPLLDLRGQASSSLPPIQLLEGTEYRYELHLPTGTSNVRCEPSSMFHPDDRSGLRGRLRTGLDTGTVTALFFHGDEPLGRATFEVRAAKLDYLTHYNRMLHELADVAAELLLERFAPAQHTFRPSPAQEPQTAYHQFAFLQSLVMSDHFEAAILQIVSNPHRTWHAQTEHRPPGAGAPARSSAMRALVGPGARAPLPGKTRLGPLTDVPVSLPYVRTEPTVDNPENRFIKHVLEEWRMFAQRV